MSDYETWKRQDELLYPPPVLLSRFVEEQDWWARNQWLVWTIIASLDVFIASRTAPGIFLANVREGYAPFWAWLLAYVATIGIEGLISFYGLSRPRKLLMTRAEEFWEKFMPFMAVFLGVFISSLAGLRASLALAETLAARIGTQVDSLLSILLGVGLTLVLYGISEFAGRIRFIKENAPRFAQQDWEQAMQQYAADSTARWLASDEYFVAHGEQKTQANVARARARAAERFGASGMRAALADANAALDFSGTQGVRHPSAAPLTNVEIARQWLDAQPERDTWQTLEDVPSARTIQAALQPRYQISPSSAQVARLRWWTENRPSGD